jgi:multidrug efflux pump subunit AcrB
VVVQSNDAKSALLENVPLCIGLMIILMVVQFNSYTRPLIIFGTIPLLLVGAVIGIYVMQANFGFMVLLGLYSLAGIVINNAIVLIDRIEIERNDNPEHQFEAVVSACVRRLRPIVMTTVTTILGLMPLIVARDALFYGMASVIAFGLLVGTVLTLGVVPVAYSLLFRIAPASTKGGSSRCSP